MKTTETSPKKLRILIALLLFGVFLAGIVVGMGFFFWFTHHRHFGHPPKLPPPFSELNLSKEQEHKVIEILDKHHGELETIVQETFPKARKIFDKIDAEVRFILTTEQRKKLDAFKQKQKLEPFSPGGLGPHRPPPDLPGFLPPGGPHPNRH